MILTPKKKESLGMGIPIKEDRWLFYCGQEKSQEKFHLYYENERKNGFFIQDWIKIRGVSMVLFSFFCSVLNDPREQVNGKYFISMNQQVTSYKQEIIMKTQVFNYIGFSLLNENLSS